MSEEILTSLARLGLAVLAGAMIGMERTFNGRPAGFRTHALVATASSALMLFTTFQFRLFPEAPPQSLQADPTRMAQGIMTGIGFLGAGVIVKEGINVRGLTTAASIWMTAAIGILIGVGFYVAAGIAEVLALGTLSIFRRLEAFMPTLYFAHLSLQLFPQEYVPEDDLRSMIVLHGVDVANVSYELEGREQGFQYGMTIRTRDLSNFRKLAEGLRTAKGVERFKIQPSGE
ncbi:MAG: MgtC/SapB family protein [Chloroflexi bacterium]|nr:MgtC/SapB family protein [Chloroflexota bacterium]